MPLPVDLKSSGTYFHNLLWTHDQLFNFFLNIMEGEESRQGNVDMRQNIILFLCCLQKHRKIPCAEIKVLCFSSINWNHWTWLECQACTMEGLRDTSRSDGAEGKLGGQGFLYEECLGADFRISCLLLFELYLHLEWTVGLSNNN